MKPRLKTISAERAVHIIDALTLWSGEWLDGEKLDPRVRKLLHDIYVVAHTCSRTSCERTHQNWIPDIRKMEKELISGGFCSRLNERGHKTRVAKQRRNKRSI